MKKIGKKPKLMRVGAKGLKEKLSEKEAKHPDIGEVLNKFKIPKGRDRSLATKALAGVSTSARVKYVVLFEKRIDNYYKIMSGIVDKETANKMLLYFAGYKKLKK